METVTIDGFEFAGHFERGRYHGVHSGSDLIEIKIDLTTETDEDEVNLTNLLGRQTVAIDDPVEQRLYRAKLRRPSFSYTRGNPVRRHAIEIRELDQWPTVEHIAINGETFNVLKYSEYEVKAGVVRDVVFHLAQADVHRFSSIVAEEGLVQFHRIGIDTEPIPTKISNTRWSMHDQGLASEHVRQAARFFPAEHEWLGFDAASQKTFNQLTRIVLRQERMIGLLTAALVDRGIVSEDLVGQIPDDGQPLTGVDAHDFLRRLMRVNDAADEILPSRD